MGFAIVDVTSCALPIYRNSGAADTVSATRMAPTTSATNSVGRRISRVGALRHAGRPEGMASATLLRTRVLAIPSPIVGSTVCTGIVATREWLPRSVETSAEEEHRKREQLHHDLERLDLLDPAGQHEPRARDVMMRGLFRRNRISSRFQTTLTARQSSATVPLPSIARLQRIGRIDRNHPAVLDDSDPIGVLGFVHVLTP